MKLFTKQATIIASALFLCYCSTTPKITSQFSETPPPSSVDLISQMENTERHNLGQIALFVTHDENHLYVMVDFISARLYQNAQDFGFTVYVDDKEGFSRSFGITYPTGLFYELGDYPGARKGYLEEPNWENMPGNESIMETARNNIAERGLLIQRRSRRDDMRPVPVPLTQLQAQNLQLQMEENEERGRVAFAIPLQVTSRTQFSPDVELGEQIELGFEIDPVRLLDMESSMQAPLINSQSASGRSQDTSDDERSNQVELLNRQLGDTFSEWIQLTLSSPEI